MNQNLAAFQLGNFLKIDAYARVEDNMLSFRTELITPTAVNFMSDGRKLRVLSSFCALVDACLPEQDNLEKFYDYANVFFNLIGEENWITHYAFFEFYLLEYLGVGLDLTECAATGTTENLAYVSPKTGKAVCAAAGEPYKEKLYKYPHFILERNYHPSVEELKDLLNLTEFFLYKNFFAAHGLKFPAVRANLAEIVTQKP